MIYTSIIATSLLFIFVLKTWLCCSVGSNFDVVCILLLFPEGLANSILVTFCIKIQLLQILLLWSVSWKPSLHIFPLHFALRIVWSWHTQIHFSIKLPLKWSKFVLFLFLKPFNFDNINLYSFFSRYFPLLVSCNRSC